MQNFFTKIQPKSIIWIFTHCESENPNEEFKPDLSYVQNKIKSYNLCVELPQNNMVFYSKKKPETLYPIEKLLVKTEMKVVNDLIEASKNILVDMPTWTHGADN